MASKALPSPEVLRQLLRYEPDTGKLFWLARDASMFEAKGGRYTPERSASIFNTTYAGKEALTPSHNFGYRRGMIFQRKLYAHRVIWAIVTGSWPPAGMDVDHINGVPDDNRFKNLRIATRSENQRNRGVQVNNKSNLKGVCRCADREKWTAQIKTHGKSSHLGTFSTPLDAHRAYVSASPVHHGDFGRTD